MSFMQSHSKNSSSAGGTGMHSSKCRFTAQDEASSRILWATPTKFMTHTLGVSCHVFINNFQVYHYDAHAESMHHEREGPTLIKINYFLLSWPPQVSKRQASRTRLANVMDGYHLKVLRHLTVSTTCGLKLTLIFSIWDKNIILVPTSCRSPILSRSIKHFEGEVVCLCFHFYEHWQQISESRIGMYSL